MPEKLTSEQRSALMGRIRRSNTKPELVVRRVLFSLGYRYRLQWRAAPGRPDVAFPGRRKAIYIHGCFWHQHSGCRLSRVPTTRRDFWIEKFNRNKARDARDLARAAQEGWSTLVIWECETRDHLTLRERLVQFIGARRL